MEIQYKPHSKVRIFSETCLYSNKESAAYYCVNTVVSVFVVEFLQLPPFCIKPMDMFLCTMKVALFCTVPKLFKNSFTVTAFHCSEAADCIWVFWRFLIKSV